MAKKVRPETLKLHTNAHAVRDRLTLKDVNERKFRNKSFREPKSSKNTQRYSKQNYYTKNTKNYLTLQENTNSLFYRSRTETERSSNMYISSRISTYTYQYQLILIHRQLLRQLCKM